ncbi:hypothetical protein [Bacillus sp. REN3]|uniref:hypothetical protein n=1 Tax=Bacillus sp. REN3 TaxID=2802440 RepID=UPI001AEDE3AB|nr:hypothetical protein [Bacillus sp. REN3]
MRKKIATFILIICSAMSLIGCSEKTTGSGKEFIFEKGQFPPKTAGYVKTDKQTYEMEKGNYKWRKGNSTLTTDAASPFQIADNFAPIEVQPDEKLAIMLEQEPDITVHNLSEKTKLENPLNDEIQVPGESGHYIYEVIAKWENGEVSYTFVIHVDERQD